MCLHRVNCCNTVLRRPRQHVLLCCKRHAGRKLCLLLRAHAVGFMTVSST